MLILDVYLFNNKLNKFSLPL